MSKLVCLMATAVLVNLLLTSCAAQTELPAGPDAVWQLVVIGDSSLWGVGEAFAAQIEADVGVDVELLDFALNQLSAGEVLKVLQTGQSADFELAKLPEALKEAEVVVMFANPLDSIDPQNPLNMAGCFLDDPPANCSEPAFAQWTEELKGIWAEIIAIRKGNATILRAVDIYNPLVSIWKENDIFEACNQCWQSMSNGARLAAEAYGIPFLSRWEAMNGIDHEIDIRNQGYIRSDGEHLTERGAQVVAGLLAGMGYEPVSPP